MKQFAQLVAAVDQATQAEAKVNAMAAYLSSVGEEDKMWMLALFCQKRPKRSLKTDQLREWVAEYLAIPDWLIEVSYQSVGDLPETLSLLLPRPEEAREDHSLAFWMKQIQDLSRADPEDQKAFLFEAWKSLDANQRFVIHKLLTGGFRSSVPGKLLVKAISHSTGLAENAIANRLTGAWTPETTTYQDLFFSEDEADRLSRPYPFQSAGSIDSHPSDLGDLEAWQTEWQWEGIRVQLIKRGGELFLWSRGGELITEKVPEVQALAERIPDGTVIEGELLAVKDDMILPMSFLQARINKKTLAKKQLLDTPCLIMAFDLLEENGQDIRTLSLTERSQKLATLVSHVANPDILRFSEALSASSWEEIAERREEARDRQASGLMLRRKTSAYQAGPEQTDWWKWKVDPLTVEAVLIYAQRGRGPNTYSEYTFAVWNEEDTLVPVAKVTPGLEDSEMKEVNSWIKQHTVERFGPVRSVTGELVFEIAFEEIHHSKRHKSGVVVRSPRMLRWRKEKKASEADRLVFLKGLIQG